MNVVGETGPQTVLPAGETEQQPVASVVAETEQKPVLSAGETGLRSVVAYVVGSVVGGASLGLQPA